MPAALRIFLAQKWCWFTDSRYAGGGAMADMGIHALDTARYLPAAKRIRQDWDLLRRL